MIPETERIPARPDWLIGLVLFAACAVLFWPLVAWMGRHALGHEQLTNTLIITSAAVVAIVWRERPRLHAVWHMSRAATLLVLVAAALVGLAGVLKRPEPVVVGMLLAVAGLVKFVWGGSARFLIRPALVALGGFLALILLMPLLDWPLRQLAGLNSAEILIRLGLAPHLVLQQTTDGAWHLVLQLERHAFIVAPECNGFGLIGSSVLLALILTQASEEPLAWRVLIVPLSAAIGFLLNVVRILAICLLAREYPGREAYDFIHETAGTLALWTGLGLVWWLSGFRLPKGPEQQRESNPA